MIKQRLLTLGAFTLATSAFLALGPAGLPVAKAIAWGIAIASFENLIHFGMPSLSFPSFNFGSHIYRSGHRNTGYSGFSTHTTTVHRNPRVSTTHTHERSTFHQSPRPASPPTPLYPVLHSLPTQGTTMHQGPSTTPSATSSTTQHTGHRFVSTPTRPAAAPVATSSTTQHTGHHFAAATPAPITHQAPNPVGKSTKVKSTFVPAASPATSTSTTQKVNSTFVPAAPSDTNSTTTTKTHVGRRFHPA